jgi:glycosyltransferase involved in cell wall biosynthesis
MKLRILFITDFYPPEHRGGYEIRIDSIVKRFAESGHDVLVISNKSRNKYDGQDRIKRILSHDDYSKSLIFRIISEVNFLISIREYIKLFKPDLVYLGHVINFPKTLLFYLFKTDQRVVFDEGGMGLSAYYRNEGAWFYFINKIKKNKFALKVIKFLLNFFDSNIPLEKTDERPFLTIFNSINSYNSFLQTGLKIERNVVIQSGIDLNVFTFVENRKIRDRVNVVIPGRITEIKGQILCIPYLIELRTNFRDLTIHFLGKIDDLSYFNEIVLELKKADLFDLCEFKGFLSHQDLALHYRDADICLFCSQQKCGFSRVPMEAIASGVVVFTFGHEGSDMFLNSEVAFELKSDEDCISDILISFRDNEKEYFDFQVNGKLFIEENLDLDNYLFNVVNCVENSCYEGE